MRFPCIQEEKSEMGFGEQNYIFQKDIERFQPRR